MLQGKLKRTRSADKRREIEEELAVPPFPKAVEYLWVAYWRIRSRRTSGEPIQLGDIAEFIRLSGLHLAPWEVSIVEALDDTWLASSSISTSENSE